MNAKDSDFYSTLTRLGGGIVMILYFFVLFIVLRFFAVHGIEFWSNDHSDTMSNAVSPRYE